MDAHPEIMQKVATAEQEKAKEKSDKDKDKVSCLIRMKEKALPLITSQTATCTYSSTNCHNHIPMNV